MNIQDRRTEDWTRNQRERELQALADKRLELLREYNELLKQIMGSRKGSVGSIDNVYLPQLNRASVDAQYDELAEAIDD